MMTYFAEVAPDGRYVQCIMNEQPSQWVVEPADPANTLYPVDAPPTSAASSPTAVLHFVDGQEVWVETASFEELRVRKNAEIDKAREEANATYFEFAGQRIACESMSWKDIMSTSAEISLTHAMPVGWVGGWKSKDKNPDGSDIFVPIPDVATWITFIQAMVNRGLVHFGKSQDLKAQLAAATTPEEVASIKWQ